MAPIAARVLLLGIAGVLAWRVVALGVARYEMDQVRDGDPNAVAKALAWHSHHPEALYRLAQSKSNEDPAVSEALLKDAYVANPADARPLMALGKLADQAGEQSRARDLLAQALQLDPSTPRVQKAVAAYWVGQGDLGRAMQHWSLAMQANPGEQSTLFPVFLEIAENPEARTLLAPFAAAPPNWWNAFFTQVARRALDLETVRFLYALRRDAHQAPIQQDERVAYIERLQRDGQITEAYLLWVNGLNDKEREQLGILNNGGFELDPSNVGFDWHISPSQNVTVNTARTYGSEGAQALHLLFKRREAPFNQVHQPLFLDPAIYRLSGKVRTDGLETAGGIRWTIACTRPETLTLGSSDRFLGSSEWHEFAFEFEVSETCESQEIRLVTTGQRPSDYKISGGAWFDTLAIRKIPAFTTPETKRKTETSAVYGVSPQPRRKADSHGEAAEQSREDSTTPPERRE